MYRCWLALHMHACVCAWPCVACRAYDLAEDAAAGRSAAQPPGAPTGAGAPGMLLLSQALSSLALPTWLQHGGSSAPPAGMPGPSGSPAAAAAADGASGMPMHAGAGGRGDGNVGSGVGVGGAGRSSDMPDVLIAATRVPHLGFMDLAQALAPAPAPAQHPPTGGQAGSP